MSSMPVLNLAVSLGVFRTNILCYLTSRLGEGIHVDDHVMDWILQLFALAFELALLHAPASLVMVVVVAPWGTVDFPILLGVLLFTPTARGSIGSIRARWHPESVISGHLLSANVEAHRCLAPLCMVSIRYQSQRQETRTELVVQLQRLFAIVSLQTTMRAAPALLPAVLLFYRDTLIDVLASFFNFELRAPDLVPRTTSA
jgi:hypothetical protein